MAAGVPGIITPNDCAVGGNLSIGGTLTLPSGIQDANIGSGAGIQAAKVKQQRTFDYSQAPGSAVVAATVDLHRVRGATGLALDLNAVITGTIATGADRTVTVDLQKSTGAGAFATVLTSTAVLNNTSTLRTAVAAVLNAALTSLVVGDLLRLVVTVAGAAGAQALGLLVTVTIQEDPA
jgi:hypothetical protein